MKIVSFFSLVLLVRADANEQDVIQVGTPFVSISGERGGVSMGDCAKKLTNGLDPFEEVRMFTLDCIHEELPTGYVLEESQRENFQVSMAAVETARRALSDPDSFERQLNPCYNGSCTAERCVFCCCTYGCLSLCWGCQGAWCLNRRGLRQGDSEFEVAMMNPSGDEELPKTVRSVDDESTQVLDDVSKACKERMVDYINEEIKTNGNNKCFGAALDYEDVHIHLDLLA